MRSPSVWLTAFSVFLLAGCGGDGKQQQAERPKLDRTVAERLAAEADRIAGEVQVDSCQARVDLATLQKEVVLGVPAPHREPLLRAIRRIAGQIPCDISPATTTNEENDDNGHGRGKDKGHKKKHGDE
jgi:hypothetical protein